MIGIPWNNATNQTHVLPRVRLLDVAFIDDWTVLLKTLAEKVYIIPGVRPVNVVELSFCVRV